LVANTILDAEGQITLWNARAQRLFGLGNEAVLGRHYSCLLDVPSTEAAHLLAAAAQAGYADYAADCKRALDGRFPAQLLLTALVKNAGVTGYSLVVQDTSERSRAKRQHSEDTARLLGVIQSAMDAIITVDEEQHIILFNKAAERIFRCPAEEAIGATLDRFIPQRFRAVHRGHIERFSATGVTTRRMGDRTVLAARRADGEEFPIEAAISQASVAGGRLFTVILRDITERQRAAVELEQSHRELQRLYGSMHEVREAERTRIARELHDELAQWLTALKMDTAWLASRLPAEQPQLTNKLDKMKAAVDTTVAAVRRIAADLRPVMLDDLGLMPAVEALLQQFSERTGIMAQLAGNAQEAQFHEPIVTAVYRMVQEALTNVTRHAQASAVQVDMHVENGKLVVRVQDNGKGIKPEDLRVEKSYGLLGIRERAHTLGGSAKIVPAEHSGTMVEVVVPLNAPLVGSARK
jgi:PAS domain S-box-containing protein